MILFPSIDLKNGHIVRLLHGRADAVTVYGHDPAAQAKSFAEVGFSWLHVVDLDGAFSGRGDNSDAVGAILRSIDLPVQLGGGIRSMSSIEGWLELGVRRVVLGTAAVKDPDLVREACKRFPGRIVVGVDAKEGFVAVEGWAETSELSTFDLARRFADVGVAALLYTDVGRDGALTGVDVAGTAALARATGMSVIASGGVAGMDDLRALKAEESAGIEGVVVGRALYNGDLDAKEALALLEGSC